MTLAGPHRSFVAKEVASYVAWLALPTPVCLVLLFVFSHLAAAGRCSSGGHLCFKLVHVSADGDGRKSFSFFSPTRLFQPEDEAVSRGEPVVKT